MSLLQIRQLNIHIGDVQVCADLDLELNAGEHWAILGRNGAGKTTLLHTLAGLRDADGGSILIDRTSLTDLPRKQLARQVGILLQDDDERFPSTVLQTALTGRHPHLDWLQWESHEDIRLAQQTLEQLGLLEMQQRDLQTLSGGERRRAHLASLLLQNPAIALLDEPGNHLDLHHQLQVLGLLNSHFKHGVIMTAMHDINMASRFCTHALLLMGEGKTLAGSANEVLTEPHLESLYGIPLRLIEHADQRYFFPN